MLSNPDRKKNLLIVGNWKMFRGTTGQVYDFWVASRNLAERSAALDVFIAPPFTAIDAASERFAELGITVGAQNIHWDPQGAHTGEISAPMLCAAGAEFVIVGHSERRQHYGETSDAVAKRTAATINSNMSAILCVGEPLHVYEGGSSREFVIAQLEASLEGVALTDCQKLIIAYEPVWSIGTGKTPDPAEAREMHGHIQDCLKSRFGKASDQIRLLYGGSVTPENVVSFVSEPNVDGVLVGGASVDPIKFEALIRKAETVVS